MLQQAQLGQLGIPDGGFHRLSKVLRKELQAASESTLYYAGRSVLDLYTRVMLKKDVHWRAPLPEGPKIIAANHPTTTDPFYILTLAPEQMSILVTEGAFDVPVFGRYLLGAGHVPAIRDSGGATVEALKRKLEAGRTVAIFPEGTLSPVEGGFHPPHSGVARLALSTGVPVVPVGIGLQRERIRVSNTELDGKDEVAHLYLEGPYALTVGEAVQFGGDVRDREQVRSAVQQIMQRIIYLARESDSRIQESLLPSPRSVPRLAGLVTTR
jgi:1-acyl-sn-glycerol-3-phosphate acyltransferase